MKKYIFSIAIGVVALVAITANALLYSKINVLEKSIAAIPKAAPVVVQPAPTPQPNLSAPITTVSGGLTNSVLDELKIKIENHDAILESLGAPPASIREWSDFYNTKYGIQFAAPFGGDDVSQGGVATTASIQGLPTMSGGAGFEFTILPKTDPNLHGCYFYGEGITDDMLKHVGSKSMVTVAGIQYCNTGFGDAGAGQRDLQDFYVIIRGDNAFVFHFNYTYSSCNAYTYPNVECVMFDEARDTKLTQEVLSTVQFAK